MPEQLPQPSKTPRRRHRVKNKIEFSKQLSIIDISCWAIITLLLLIVMLIQPSLAEYCVNIFGAATAAYVSLRLGYTAKAGIENYKKISSSLIYNYDEGNG